CVVAVRGPSSDALHFRFRSGLLLTAPSVAPQLLRIAAAIEIERVVEVPLAADGFVVVVALGGGETPEAFRDRLEAGGLRREIAMRRIGAAHDQRQAPDCLVLDVVLLDDGVERPFCAVMTQLDPGNVVGDGAGLARYAIDLADRNG